MFFTKVILAILTGVLLVAVGYKWGASTRPASQVDANQTADVQSLLPQSESNSSDSHTIDSTITAPSSQLEENNQRNTRQRNASGSGSDLIQVPASSTTSSISSDDNPSALPIPNEIHITEPAEKILSEGRPAELHKKLEASDRNDSWSPYMEAQIRGYLDQKPSLSDFTFAVIECREFGCEIQAVGYTQNANQIWVNATADIYSQPWFEFKGMSTSVSEFGGSRDVLGLVVILLRENDE